jgi:hypothetical protein
MSVSHGRGLVAIHGSAQTASTWFGLPLCEMSAVSATLRRVYTVCNQCTHKQLIIYMDMWEVWSELACGLSVLAML